MDNADELRCMHCNVQSNRMTQNVTAKGRLQVLLIDIGQLTISELHSHATVAAQRDANRASASRLQRDGDLDRGNQDSDSETVSLVDRSPSVVYEDNDSENELEIATHAWEAPSVQRRTQPTSVFQTRPTSPRVDVNCRTGPPA
jgi:hypothetical protein